MMTIVGAGPSGLTASILLSQNKIPHRVLERRSNESGHPRATVLNTRSMEIMRQMGVAERLQQQALTGDLLMSMRWFQNLASPELSRYDLTDNAASLLERVSFSPAMSCICPQDIIEPTLLAHARKSPYAEIHLGAEVISTHQNKDGVYNTVRYANGSIENIHSTYLLAADGANSQIRDTLGIAMLGETSQQWVLNVHFRADLSAVVKKHPAFLYWIVGTKASGVFIALNGTNRWLFNKLLPAGERDHTPEHLREMLQIAAGNPNLEPEILHCGAWLARAEVAEQYRSGRIFLVGDAAHRFPPTGGFGMNSGIQDAHNLAWKLAMVLQNKAGEALLETYEAERRPVAISNAKLSWSNFRALADEGLGVNPLALQLEQGGVAHRLAKAALQASMPAQKDHFDYAGQELGFMYDSSATIADAVPAPEISVSRYVPSTTPGARAPHLWVKHNNALHSSLDLVQGWTLFAAAEAEAWVKAAQIAAAKLGLEQELRIWQVGRDFFDTTAQEQQRARSMGNRLSVRVLGKIVFKAVLQNGIVKLLKNKATPFAQTYRIGTTGAVLVRPDGHVAWRSLGAPPEEQQVLLEVLTQVLGRVPSSQSVQPFGLEERGNFARLSV